MTQLHARSTPNVELRAIELGTGATAGRGGPPDHDWRGGQQGFSGGSERDERKIRRFVQCPGACSGAIKRRGVSGADYRLSRTDVTLPSPSIRYQPLGQISTAAFDIPVGRVAVATAASAPDRRLRDHRGAPDHLGSMYYGVSEAVMTCSPGASLNRRSWRRAARRGGWRLPRSSGRRGACSRARDPTAGTASAVRRKQ